MSQPERPPCGICGRGAHRYGTSDPEHKYDAMGCVNMLLPVVEKLTEALRQIDAVEPYSGSVMLAVTDWAAALDKAQLIARNALEAVE